MRRSLLRSRLAVAAVAGGAAVGGVLAEPTATGLAGFDALLRAILCGGTVLLVSEGGTRSRPRRRLSRWMVVAAAALAVAGSSLPAMWLAGCGFGLALGAASAHLNAPVLRALTSAFVTQAALRLERPGFALGSALMAAVVLTLLLGGGVTGLRRRARGPYVKVAVVAVSLTVIFSALGAWAVFRARAKVNDGITLALSGVDQARAGNIPGSAPLFDQAAASFSDASGRLHTWWARPAAVVPVVGRHGQALVAIADSGSALSAAGARAAREGDATRVRLAGGSVPLDAIASLRKPAAEALSSLTDAGQRLAKARSPWLLSPVSSRLDLLTARVSQARRDVEVVAATAEVAPAMLGGDRPRRYFLALQTPVELRGTGGFIGTFGEISADRGQLRLERLGRAAELIRGGTPPARRLDAPADYLARYSRFDPARTWQNINMSPDLPSVAKAITSLYPQSGGRPVDGVIAVDPIGLSAVLRVVGPVPVREWPIPLSADNAVRILSYEQYVRYQGDERVDFLNKVTDAVWQRLTSSTPGVVQLAQALSPVMAQKHIQIASTEPAEEQALVRLGVAGAIAPVEGDFLGVVTQNAGGNKIDWFLRRAVDYKARFDPDSGEVRSTVRITLRNQAPAEGLPDYIIGSATTPPLTRGANKLYLSVYTPLGLVDARVDGRPALFESELERGRSVYSTYVVVPAGGASIVELELEGRLEGREGGRPYRLDLHRQPFLAADAVTTSLQLDGGWRAHREGPSEAPGPLELVTDRRIQVVVRRSA